MKIDIIISTGKGFDKEVYLKLNNIEAVIADIGSRSSTLPVVHYDLPKLEIDTYYLVFNLSTKKALEKYGADCQKIILITTDRGISDENGIETNFLAVVDFISYTLNRSLIYAAPGMVAKLNAMEVQRFKFNNGKELVLLHMLSGKTWGGLFAAFLEAYES